MSLQIQPLIEPTVLQNVPSAALFTAQQPTAIISLVVSNPGTAASPFILAIVPQGASPTSANQLVPNGIVDAASQYSVPEAPGIVLNPGDGIYLYAPSGGSLVGFCGGMVQST